MGIGYEREYIQLLQWTYSSIHYNIGNCNRKLK